MLCRSLAGDEIHRFGKSVVIIFGGKRRVVGTGPLNGGYQAYLTSVFNHDLNPEEGLPKILRAPTYEEHMALVAQDLGLEPGKTSGLGTSVSMDNTSIITENHEGLEVIAITTAGVEANAGRAGDPASYDERHILKWQSSGTINIIILINANLTPGALAGCLITSTEAKTAALQELIVDSRYSSGLATGTGTDGTIVVCNTESDLLLTNTGKHSKLGELIGITVKRSVKEALLKQAGLDPLSQHSFLRRWRRYGITAESLWDCYCQPENSPPLLRSDFIKYLSQLENNNILVTCSSLLVHLLDQLNWKLINEEEATEAAKVLLRKVQKELHIKHNNTFSVMGDSFEKRLLEFFQIIIVSAINSHAC